MYDIDRFAHTLKAMRKKSFKSIFQFACRCGISISALYTYEANSQLPNLLNFLALCETLQVSPNELLGWDATEEVIDAAS